VQSKIQFALAVCEKAEHTSLSANNDYIPRITLFKKNIEYALYIPV
jgi:hypothetical protein